MPIFEYTCGDCRRTFEWIVRAGERAACPSCGGRRLTKQLSVFAVGGSQRAASASPSGPCGSCGDPRGPGSCALD